MLCTRKCHASDHNSSDAAESVQYTKNCTQCTCWECVVIRTRYSIRNWGHQEICVPFQDWAPEWAGEITYFISLGSSSLCLLYSMYHWFGVSHLCVSHSSTSHSNIHHTQGFRNHLQVCLWCSFQIIYIAGGWVCPSWPAGTQHLCGVWHTVFPGSPCKHSCGFLLACCLQKIIRLLWGLWQPAEACLATWWTCCLPILVLTDDTQAGHWSLSRHWIAQDHLG